MDALYTESHKIFAKSYCIVRLISFLEEIKGWVVSFVNQDHTADKQNYNFNL